MMKEEVRAMRAPGVGIIVLISLVLSLSTGARADFADGVRAYEAGDYATAHEEWLPLAERGDPAAERNIGHLYRMGWSVRQDFVEAAKWYRRSAEKGFARAQANLGNMYLRGQGLERDYALAAEWFRRAALQGHAVAQYNLGLMFENGRGVEQSDAKAMGWYHLASKSGHRRAQDKLALLIAKSTSELATLVQDPVVEAAAGAAEEARAATETPAPEVEPAEIAVLAPVEAAETAAPEPAEPAEIAVPEPVKPAEVAEAPVMEGPRREPVEVVLGERAPEPAAFEVAVIEPAAGDAGTDAAPVEEEASAQALAALVPAEPTEERAAAPLAEPVEPVLDASALAPETAEPVAVAADLLDADDGTAMEEEDPGLFAAVLDALKGQSRRDREGPFDADPAAGPDDGAAARDADGLGDEKTAASLEMVALEPGEVAAEGRSMPDEGAETAAEPAAPDDEGVEADGRVAGEAAIDWDEPPASRAAGVEMAALGPIEPTEEDVAPSLGETVEPALEAPAPAPETAELLAADANAADEDDGVAMEEEEPGFFAAFLDALKGQSRREREGSIDAEPAAGPDDELVAMDAAADDSGPEETAEPLKMAALGPASATVGGEGAEEALEDAEDVGSLALDALRGETQAAEAPEAAPGEAERELAEAPDEEAATPDIAALADGGEAADEPSAGAPPIDWHEPQAAPELAAVAEDEAPSDFEDANARIDWREPTDSDEETEDEETAAAGMNAVAEAEEGVSEAEGADSLIIRGEPGVESASLAEGDPFVAPASETEPPVEVTARAVSSSATLPAADFAAMSVAERLWAGLAAYRAGDYATAVTAWLPLAEKGIRMAQFYVGGLYFDGTGLPVSRVWAHVFWMLAAERGHEKARELLDELTADMLPAEIAEARDLAAAWRPMR